MKRLSILLLAATLFGQEWNKSEFPEWSERTVLRLLTDSPWTRATKVKLTWEKQGRPSVDYREIPGNDRSAGRPLGGPIPGIGVPRVKLPLEADLLVRWASALPVREATAAYKRLNGKPGAAVDPAPPDYVLEVRGIPSPVAHMGAASVEAVAMQGATLRAGDGALIKPSEAHVTLEGETLTLRIHFPRREPIPASGREVELLANMQIFEIHVKFRLAPMVYRGTLEL